MQVVRCFENSDIEHVMDSVDPDSRHRSDQHRTASGRSRQHAEAQDAKQQKAAKGGDKKALAEIDLMDRLEPHLSDGKFAYSMEMSPEEQALLKAFFLLTAKPTLFACNVAEDELGDPAKNPWVAKVREYAAHHHGTRTVVVSAEIESELVTLSPEERAEYLAGLGVEQPGSVDLIRDAYYLLGLRTYLTTGEKETRAWTIHAGDKAPVAAGVIHSDFEKSFISAETVSYDDLVSCGSFARARELGKLRTEGKEYVVQDGDVMEFKTFL